MKMAIVMALALVSFNSFASDCRETVLEIAQLNLDQQAYAYGFEEGSAIDSESILVTEEPSEDGSNMYMVNGYIYKASYSVFVDLDSSCRLQSVSIQEVL